MDITPIPAFDDNYIWLLQTAGITLVIDPGDAQPVLAHLQTKGLALDHILLTHFHYDHVDGVQALTESTGATTIGPADPRLRVPCEEIQANTEQWQTFGLGNLEVNVLSVPGHTVPHLAWYLNGHLFCGDTLFSLGCGRLFDGTATQLHHSLQQLCRLPDDTLVYPAHEYTLANLRFALHILPDDAALQAYGEKLQQRRQRGPTLPVLLGEEKRCNPFLRCDEPMVQQAVALRSGQAVHNALECFTLLRQLKDRFRG